LNHLQIKSCLKHCRIDVNAAAIFVETDVAIHKGENGVILAKADTAAWDPLGAALAEDDVASDDGFTAKFLDAQTLALAVSTVFDGTLSFFMGHESRVGESG